MRPTERVRVSETERARVSVCMNLFFLLQFLVLAWNVIFNVLQPDEDVMRLVEELAQDGRVDVLISAHHVDEGRTRASRARICVCVCEKEKGTVMGQ